MLVRDLLSAAPPTGSSRLKLPAGVSTASKELAIQTSLQSVSAVYSTRSPAAVVISVFEAVFTTWHVRGIQPGDL